MNTSITVVIPTYNRRDVLARAIESVHSQTLQPDELIVVDDGSDDGTPEWVARAHPDALLICLPVNRGAAHARNAAIRRARGSVLAFLDSDDRWEPGFLAESIDRLRVDPGAVLVVSDVNMVLARPKLEYVHKSRPGTGYRDMVEHLLFENFITTMSSIAVRRSAIASVGLLRESLRVVHDRDWYIRLANVGGFTYTGQALVWRHIDEDNLVSDHHAYFADVLRFWHGFFRSGLGVRYEDCRLKLLERQLRWFAGAALDRGESGVACQLLLKAFGCTVRSFRPDWTLLARIGRITSASVLGRR